MNKNIKLLLPLIALMGIQNAGWSQEKKKYVSSEQSEIVMTQDELDAFLAKIAQRKREQMERRSKELLINEQLNTNSKTNLQKKSVTTINETLEPINYNSNNNDDRMLRELDRINQRIDLLMMNGSLNQQPQAIGYNTPSNQGRSNTIVYQPPQGQQTYYQPYQQPIVQQPLVQQPIVEKKIINETNQNDKELAQMRQQVDVLNEELRVLKMLSSSDTAHAGYKAEIAALNDRINSLNVSSKTTIYEVNRSPELSNELRNYKQKIYFANNSIELSAQDKAHLEQVADIVTANAPKIVVVVRGFASQRGNAQYNNSLSFKRADAVKKVLISKGLKAKDIVTLYHGVDQTTSEDEARRVEVSFLAN